MILLVEIHLGTFRREVRTCQRNAKNVGIDLRLFDEKVSNQNYFKAHPNGESR